MIDRIFRFELSRLRTTGIEIALNESGSRGANGMESVRRTLVHGWH